MNIIVLVGPSGSGKTTQAQAIQSSTPNSVIISRDKIREMTFGYTEESIKEYYERKDLRSCEDLVTNIFDSMVKCALRKNQTVIADNTHLQLKYINAYQKFGVPVSYKVFNTPLQRCIRYDEKRVRKVGTKIIKKQYDQFDKLCKRFKFDEFVPKPLVIGQRLVNCVVFDLDGTLADISHREAFGFHEDQIIDDKINHQLRDLILSIKDKQKIIICSGRSDQYKEKTIEWLQKWNVQYDELHMRPAKDFRKDWILKQEMWQYLEHQHYNIEYIVDDRDQCVDHARRLGYNVYQVNYGDF